MRYLYIKRNVEKVWGVRYTLGARYLSKNTVILHSKSHSYAFFHFGITLNSYFVVLSLETLKRVCCRVIIQISRKSYGFFTFTDGTVHITVSWR
jgi:fructose/tagatose bisphosphate aldolase